VNNVAVALRVERKALLTRPHCFWRAGRRPPRWRHHPLCYQILQGV